MANVYSMKKTSEEVRNALILNLSGFIGLIVLVNATGLFTEKKCVCK